MKKALALLVQFVVFLLVFLVGSLLNPFHLRWFVTHPTPASTRDFSPGGLILVVSLYVLILAVELSSARWRRHGSLTTIVVLAALLVGLVGHFGFATHELF